MRDVVAVVLAAGRGTRMKSDTPKVLHEILGRPIISYVFDSLKKAGVSRTITVAGYGRELLRSRLTDTKIVVQEKLLGSGDAVNKARPVLKSYRGDVLVICGDTPLVRSDSIRRIIKKHRSSGASLTLFTVELDDPADYGRIVRDANDRVVRIVEAKDATPDELAIKEINVGTYCFKAKDLFDALRKVRPDNKKKELYLTDTIEILRKQGKRIEAVVTPHAEEIIGVNTRKDLAEASTILKYETLEKLMISGVTIHDPASTTIYESAKIARDSVIYPNTIIESDVVIGKGCHIGPFARLRPGVRLGDRSEVGNFVELVRTRVGRDTKIKHHTYLGDTDVGNNVNIGAGTITANYDGRNKNRTIIEDGAFIGVGTILIAPVKVGKKGSTGAGSVVPKNHNVPAGATVVGIPARVFKSK